MFEFITKFFKRIEPRDIANDEVDELDRPVGPVIRKIGEGGYGCVYRPQIQCDDKRPVKDGTISKLMSLRDAMAEYRSTRLISQIDREQIFHYPVIDECRVANQLDCPGKKVEHQLVYEDGGNPLAMHIVNKVSTHRNDQFFNGLWRLFVGLYAIHNNDTYHFDIKPDNIVVKRGNGEYTIKFLDFGLSKTSSELIFEGDNGWPWYHSYPWHPVETLFLSRDVLKIVVLIINQRGSLTDLLRSVAPYFSLSDRVDMRVRATGESHQNVDTLMRQNINTILNIYTRLYQSDPANADMRLFRFIYTRIDVYSLGVTLLQTSKLIPDIRNLAIKMASINIMKRPGPCRALNEYLILGERYMNKDQILQIGNRMIPQDRRGRINECMADQEVIDRLHQKELSDNM